MMDYRFAMTKVMSASLHTNDQPRFVFKSLSHTYVTELLSQDPAKHASRFQTNTCKKDKRPINLSHSICTIMCIYCYTYKNLQNHLRSCFNFISSYIITFPKSYNIHTYGNLYIVSMKQLGILCYILEMYLFPQGQNSCFVTNRNFHRFQTESLILKWEKNWHS